MTKKILVDLERQRHLHTGLGYYCRCLERGLRELHLLSPRLIYYKGTHHGASSDVRQFHHRHSLFNPTTWGCDALHVTHQFQRYFSRTFPVKRILTLHDLNFLYESLSPDSYRRTIKKVRRNLAQADVIVCISHFVKASLLEHREMFDLKPTVRIEVIHNGIILDEVISVRTPDLEPITAQDYLLCIGVLHDKKQQHKLLEMLPHVDPKLHLVLVYSEAKDTYMEQIVQLIVEHRLEDRVHLLYRIHAEEKQYLLENCLALVHPSKAEGFGIPPIEAMALGKPVFLSQATSLPEIGGEEAYYFPDTLEPRAMAECLEQGLLDYQTHRQAKAERLKQWASRYDYRTMARAYADLYIEMLSTP